MQPSPTQAQEFVADNRSGSNLEAAAGYSGALRVSNVRYVFSDGSSVVISGGRATVYSGKHAKQKK